MTMMMMMMMMMKMMMMMMMMMIIAPVITIMIIIRPLAALQPWGLALSQEGLHVRFCMLDGQILMADEGLTVSVAPYPLTGYGPDKHNSNMIIVIIVTEVIIIIIIIV